MNQTSTPHPSSRRNRIAAVSASWHSAIVHRARDAFLAELQRHGRSPDEIDLIDVPGAFEIPLLARKLACSGQYEAIAAFGLVVDGGIYRHDFVAYAVIEGLMRVQLDTGTPVISAVLTPHFFHEHDEHKRYFGDHFVIKGKEAAQALLRTIELHRGQVPLVASTLRTTA